MRTLADRRRFMDGWAPFAQRMLESLPDAADLHALVRYELPDRAVAALERRPTVTRLGRVAVRVAEPRPIDLGWSTARFGQELGEAWIGHRRVWKLRPLTVRRARRVLLRPLAYRLLGHLGPGPIEQNQFLTRAQCLVAWLGLEAARFLEGRPAIGALIKNGCVSGEFCRAHVDYVQEVGVVTPRKRREKGKGKWMRRRPATPEQAKREARSLRSQLPALVLTMMGRRGRPRGFCEACRNWVDEIEYQRQLRDGFPDPRHPGDPTKRLPQKKYRFHSLVQSSDPDAEVEAALDKERAAALKEARKLHRRGR